MKLQLFMLKVQIFIAFIVKSCYIVIHIIYIYSSILTAVNIVYRYLFNLNVSTQISRLHCMMNGDVDSHCQITIKLYS